MPQFVKDLLISEIYTIDAEDPIKNAANIMNNLGISCLIVTTNGLAVGIITERDFMKTIMFNIENIHDLPVKNFMSDRLIMVNENATIMESLELMTHNKIKKLPVKNEDGTIVGIISMTDIVNQQPKIMSRTLELEQENEGLDSYTYTVAHDLKAPLRHIASYSNILREDYGSILDTAGVQYIDRMIKATVQMNSLIEDLLNLSKVDKMESDNSEQSLNMILEDIIDESSSRKYSDITNDCPNYLVTNSVLIKQLFTNLISNGLKFNKSNPPRVNISSTNLENGVQFKVKDNGIGIALEHHQKIFELFTRLHNQEEYPGTGAGLTICKKIMEKLGGTISLESKSGEGTTFLIKLPDSIIREDTRNRAPRQPQIVSMN